jgi:hypothetical protein
MKKSATCVLLLVACCALPITGQPVDTHIKKKLSDSSPHDVKDQGTQITTSTDSYDDTVKDSRLNRGSVKREKQEEKREKQEEDGEDGQTFSRGGSKQSKLRTFIGSLFEREQKADKAPDAPHDNNCKASHIQGEDRVLKDILSQIAGMNTQLATHQVLAFL